MKIKVQFTHPKRTSPPQELELVDAFNKARGMAMERQTNITLDIWVPDQMRYRRFITYAPSGMIKELHAKASMK